MPRKRLTRRFEPRYGVSTAMIEAEAEWLAREVKDHELLSSADLAAKRVERHASTEHSWKHLQLLLEPLSERDRMVLQCLLFRDFYHVLELYVSFVRASHPTATTPAPPVTSPGRALEFDEWLFEIPPGKGVRNASR